MNLLIQYYEGKIPSLSEDSHEAEQISTLKKDEVLNICGKYFQFCHNFAPYCDKHFTQYLVRLFKNSVLFFYTLTLKPAN